jgi:hypothetical protein
MRNNFKIFFALDKQKRNGQVLNQFRQRRAFVPQDWNELKVVQLEGV